MILVLDEGTSSTRALLFDGTGQIHGIAQREIENRYPQPGWVEQDASEIWEATFAVAQEMVAKAGGAEVIDGIGITNQRETVVAWDPETGEPLAPAIVWQDRRTADACAALCKAGHEAEVQARTGLLLDPYFSATKMRWLIDNVPKVANCRQLAFGTIDSWLLFKLTGRHVTDASNASRTLLMDLEQVRWDEGLCDLFGILPRFLPEIVPMCGDLGETTLFGASIPVTGSVGDQQAATIGQGCLMPGATKATFGTGLFALASTGQERPSSQHRLLSTLLLDDGKHRLFALEGSVFVAGSLVQWLRDMAGLVNTADETEALARSVSDNGGVTIIPAFTGLGAPHWRPDVTGSVHGLTFGVTRAHLVRAALEAVTMSCRDLAEAFSADGAAWESLRVDGGMIANDWLAQDLADMLGLTVERPSNVESTARGAAMLAAAGAGLFEGIGEAVAAMLPVFVSFEPAGDRKARTGRISQWENVLGRALAP
ncbi:glycerol kinase GlpK [Sphingomicrobium clamense]|uniref:ATP:glycerol 3-phosphotransferase n=1 Tax=Sphingomicrobium clamense TaxID=2851013 RepID=A0ABS6V289_9SPHN|nr:glycerol kinase GlpK [Sphingomicrobium sp. B8]MBW0143687.1 glycerol kinase GlpK [Sphingomicrobium sp. B8]